ncbi:MAG: hypothetical protein H0W07_10190 [Chloroflexi bacterium]|nr:hypothetical protein [Chloroflexota bacterium]
MDQLRRQTPEAVGPRPRSFDRRDLTIVAATTVLGAVVGLLLHYARSLPPGQGSIAGFVVIVFVGVLVVGAAYGLLQWAAGQPVPLMAMIGLVVGFFAALPFGPSATPAITVPGTYAVTLSGIQGTVEGEAACDWAAGRTRIAQVRVSGLPYEDGAANLTVYLLAPRTTVETPRAAYRWTGEEAVQPIDSAVPVSADGSSGAIRLFVVRAEVPAQGTEDEPADLTGTIRWQCLAAPPA